MFAELEVTVSDLSCSVSTKMCTKGVNEEVILGFVHVAKEKPYKMKRTATAYQHAHVKSNFFPGTPT